MWTLFSLCESAGADKNLFTKRYASKAACKSFTPVGNLSEKEEGFWTSQNDKIGI
jgi:hypothetical protein